MALLYTTTSEVAALSGELVDISFTAAMGEIVELFAMGRLCVISRYNWADKFNTLNADVAGIVREYCARHIAMAGISYNMAGFTSRIEAENMLNIHWAQIKAIEALLSDGKSVTYTVGA